MSTVTKLTNSGQWIGSELRCAKLVECIIKQFHTRK